MRIEENNCSANVVQYEDVPNPAAPNMKDRQEYESS